MKLYLWTKIINSQSLKYRRVTHAIVWKARDYKCFWKPLYVENKKQTYRTPRINFIICFRLEYKMKRWRSIERWRYVLLRFLIRICAFLRWKLSFFCPFLPANFTLLLMAVLGGWLLFIIVLNMLRMLDKIMSLQIIYRPVF